MNTFKYRAKFVRHKAAIVSDRLYHALSAK